MKGEILDHVKKLGAETDVDISGHYDAMERMMLENLIKTQKRSVEVLQTTVEETDEKDSLPDAKAVDVNPTPQLTGYLPQVESSSKSGNLARSTSILLKDTVPVFQGNENVSSAEHSDPFPTRCPPPREETGYSSPDWNPDTAGYTVPSPPRPQPSYSLYGYGRRPMSSRYRDPPMRSDSPGLNMAVGVSAPVFQNSDIDVLLLN